MDTAAYSCAISTSIDSLLLRFAVKAMKATDIQTNHIWLLCCDVSQLDDVSVNAVTDFLNPSEKKRLDKFRFPSDQKLYAAARLIQYMGLCQLLDREPEQIEFTRGAHGKPALQTPNDSTSDVTQENQLDFNLSHSGNWAVGVFGRARVGVDVENCHRNNDVLAIANRYFFAQELDDMFAEKGVERDNFFKLWTLKEAYMKARGEGISLGLDNFGFIRDYTATSGYKLVCSEKINDDDQNWTFDTAMLDDKHRLSIVTENKTDTKRAENVASDRSENNTSLKITAQQIKIESTALESSGSFSNLRQKVESTKLDPFGGKYE